MLFSFLKQCARVILSFSNNELITSYGSVCDPSNSIRLHTTKIGWYDTRYDFPSNLSHSTFCRIVYHGHNYPQFIFYSLATMYIQFPFTKKSNLQKLKILIIIIGPTLHVSLVTSCNVLSNHVSLGFR